MSTQATRIETIASFINGVAYKVISAMDATQAVRDANSASLKAANEGEFSSRNGLLVECATASVDGEWTEDEIKSAASKVIAACNAEGKVKKSLQNITSEIKGAMHPNARAYVANLIKLADTAFSEEEEAAKAEKGTPTPLKLAFARRYLLAQKLIAEAKNECRVYTTTREVLGFAAHHDPRFDPKALKKRLERITSDLSGFHGDCALDVVANAVASFADVTENVIQRAIKSKPSKPNLTFVHPNMVQPVAPAAPPAAPTLTLPKAPVNTGAPKPPAKQAQVKGADNTMGALNKLMDAA